MNSLSLFSGIGGMSLAAEWAGFTTRAFVENNKFCQQVLNKHWPEVPVYGDIKGFSVELLVERGIDPASITLIEGGFPCQDISLAGGGAGLAGQRSGLWFEYYRLIRDIRPKYVVVENVSALVKRGLKTVLGCLAEIGYDAEWDSLSAAEVGAPHKRERTFIVAYPHAKRGAKRMGHILERAEAVRQRGTGLRTELWLQTPDSVGGMDDGSARKLYKPRVGSLGNAVVPQQVYPIFKAIAEWEANS